MEPAHGAKAPHVFSASKPQGKQKGFPNVAPRRGQAEEPGCLAACLWGETQPRAVAGTLEDPGSGPRQRGRAAGRKSDPQIKGLLSEPGSLRALGGKSHSVCISLPLPDSFTFMLY